MQNDPQGVGRPASAGSAVPSVNPSDSPARPVSFEASTTQAAEFGGPTGPEPTRFGDWERKGRCIDF
ncbi:MAG: DUF1674 domain-containing protein [Gammaproteobacteria bacterium]|nr:DUF1674 domain-containing protein [Gammaproteobacteria bacterium]